MSDKDLQEFKADHEGGDVVKGGEVMEPVTGAGGEIKKRKADVMKSVDPKADTVDTVAPGNKVVKEDSEVTESFESLFEGMDLSEDFKSKLSLVFEAAVNEVATAKAAEVTESLEEQFQAQLEESVNEAMEDIVENLDNYLDYVVAEWMEENKVAIEAGIKVEMAESFMEGLKSLFYEHNVAIDEETIDVVSDLEEELASMEEKANAAINESIELAEEVKALRAEKVFAEMTEGLTTTQVERFRILSEKLNFEDLESYKDDLATLKESFFKAKAPVIVEEVEEEVLTEETAPKKLSSYDSVNALAAAISSIKK